MVKKNDTTPSIKDQDNSWVSLGTGEAYPSLKYCGRPLPKKCRIYEFSMNRISELLLQAGSGVDQSIYLTLPDPDFKKIEFKLWRPGESSSATTKIYVGHSNANPNTKICLDLSAHGLHAMVNTDGDMWYISPVDSEEKVYFVYNLSDLFEGYQFWEDKEFQK